MHSQDIQPFSRPKVDLEQYPTGAEIASRMLFTVSDHYLYKGRQLHGREPPKTYVHFSCLMHP